MPTTIAAAIISRSSAGEVAISGNVGVPGGSTDQDGEHQAVKCAYTHQVKVAIPASMRAASKHLKGPPSHAQQPD